MSGQACSSKLLEQCAREHETILSELAPVDYAPAALQDNEAVVLGMKQRLDEMLRSLAAMQQKTKSERKDWTKLQNSAGRRLLVRIQHGGKKAAVGERINKEEKEYMEALEAEHKEEQRVAALQNEKAQLDELNIDLRNKARKYEKLRAQLDSLYHTVFDGPTPAYPIEDEAESALAIAERRYSVAQSCMNQESQALSLLCHAKKCLEGCADDLKMAQAWNYNDMFEGGIFSDLVENNALVDAKALSCRAEALVEQARAVQPQIARLGTVDIAQLDFLVNVIFDNVYSDIMFAKRIQESMVNVNLAADRVRAEIHLATERVRLCDNTLSVASDKMLAQRRHLEDIRRMILLSISQGLSVPQPFKDSSAPSDSAETFVDSPPPYNPPVANASSEATVVGQKLTEASPTSEYDADNAALLTSRYASTSTRSFGSLNPYADSLLRGATNWPEADMRSQGARVPMPDRSVSQLIRNRRAAAGVSIPRAQVNYI